MNKWISLLLVLLSASLALNLYLLSGPSKSNIFDSTKNKSNNKNGNPQASKSSDSLVDRKLTDIAAKELNQHPFAVNSYSPTNNTQSSDLAANRAELLGQANLWLKEKKLLTLGAFLQDYLKQYPQDMDFLLLEAKLNVHTSLLSDAIAYYYHLLRNPMTALQKSEIEQQIEQLSTNTIGQLKRNYSWDILAMFVEPLLQLAPNNRLYILSLAKAYAELFQQGLMENVLASLEYDDPDAEKIREIILAQQIASNNGQNNGQNNEENNYLDEGNEDDAITHLGRPIPLKKFADQYVVEAKLSGNPVALLIDTGASVTAISSQYFDDLSNRYKINYLGSFNMATAGGQIMARMYQFRELTIGHVTVQDLPVVVLPMQGIKNADGLLGMNFLREFDFKIDQRQSVMFIK